MTKILTHFPACLLIGDEAMKAKKALENSKLKTLNSSFYVYDLGELWFKHTGLPFVFALWIASKNALRQKEELIKNLATDFIHARKFVPQKFSLIALHAPQRKWLSVKELAGYWEGISYDFTDKHLEGLKLFEKYALKK
jgi:chorismate dehydratase